MKRAAKAQLTSLSALLLSYLAALLLVNFLHVNYYIANPLGICIAFIYNFFISKCLVFRSQALAASSVSPALLDNNGLPQEVEQAL